MPTAEAAADCQFSLGFRTVHDAIPGIVGACVDDESHNPINGDGLQHTAAWHGKGGLLVWRKADNWTAFTDGATTWINGPYGLQQRLNTEHFDWESPQGPTEQVSVPAPEVDAYQRSQQEWVFYQSDHLPYRMLIPRSWSVNLQMLRFTPRRVDEIDGDVDVFVGPKLRDFAPFVTIKRKDATSAQPWKKGLSGYRDILNTDFASSLSRPDRETFTIGTILAGGRESLLLKARVLRPDTTDYTTKPASQLSDYRRIVVINLDAKSTYSAWHFSLTTPLEDTENLFPIFHKMVDSVTYPHP